MDCDDTVEIPVPVSIIPGREGCLMLLACVEMKIQDHTVMML